MLMMRALPVVLSGCVACGVATAQSLLDNGGFDGGFGEDGVADGWLDNSSWANLDVEYAPETQNCHSGQACQKLTCTRLESGAVQVIPAKPVPLRKGVVYHVSGWIRGDRGDAALQLRLAPAPYTVYVEDHLSLTSEWRDLSYFWTSSVDDPNGVFMIRLTDCHNVWIDDVSVREVTAEEARRIAGEPAQGDLLHNGSFHLGLANWLLGHPSDYWEEARLSVVDTEAGPALKMVVPSGVQGLLSSEVARPTPGHPLRLSCRLRAESETSVLLNVADAWEQFQAGPKWQTVALEATTPFQPHPVACVRVNVSGPATVWLNDVQLRQDGGSISNDAPKAAVISDRHPLSLYHDGEAPKLRLLTAPPQAGAQFRWQVVDYWGDPVASGSWASTGDAHSQTVTLEDLQRGWYHVTVTWVHAGRDYSNESTFCVLPPPERSGDIATSPYGAHFAVDDTSLRLAKAVGVRWLRLHPPNHTKWKIVEPEQGRWAWRDEPIRKARAAGLELVGSLDRLPDWASSAPPDVKPRGFYLGPTAWLPRDWSEWENYVAEVVRRYKDDIRIWEVWNEPNLTDWLVPPEGRTRAECYAEVLQHTYPVVKREQPDATVWGACVAGPMTEGSSAWEFAEKIISLGALEYMDVFSFHEYIFRPVDEHADPIEAQISRLRERMHAAGKLMPIVNSEGGFSRPGTSLSNRPAPSGVVPAHDMAAYLVRQHVSQFAVGVNRFFFYNFFIDGSPVVRMWEGFLEGDGQPRANVAAYATMTWLLDDATFEQTERPSDDLWIHYFGTPRGRLAVAWSRTGTTVRHRFRGAEAAWDLMGADVNLPRRGTLTITQTPTYILLSSDR